MKEDDGVEHFLTCCDHDSILFFSDRGVAYCLRAYQIPTASRTSRGVPIVQMLPIPRNEKITSIVPVSEFSEDEYLIMLTCGGFIKKTALAAFSNIRANGLIAISLEEGDQLRWVRRARAEDSIIIGSRQGMAIHFRTDHEQLRPIGRDTRGVRSMKLTAKDELIGMDILPSSIVAELVQASESDLENDLEELNGDEQPIAEGQGPWVLIITTGGYGKRVPVSQFRLQNRAGKGVIATKFKPHQIKDQLAALRVVNAEDELMMVTSRGIIIRQSVNAISSQSRSATGVRVQRLDEDDAIAAVALVPPSNGEEEAIGEEELEEAES
jgi:DNA gyrase subunit A